MHPNQAEQHNPFWQPLTAAPHSPVTIAIVSVPHPCALLPFGLET